MIIDVHAHLGIDCVFDETFTRQELEEKHLDHGIDISIVQPASCHDLESVRSQHDEIARLAAEFPGRYYGMANPNPHLPSAIYEAEVRRCVEELGFVGLKIHTFAHAVNPAGRDGRKVFELARKLDIPVMIHTGAGIPFANPTNLIPIANDYPDVKIVLAHCGMMIMAGEMPIVLKNRPNVYADITWTGGFMVRRWSETFGADRFLYGSDHADNAGSELAKVRTSGIPQEHQDWILAKSALSVYTKINR